MSFFDRLERATIDGRLALVSVPQIQAALAGKISRETYIAYLTQAYHHVKHTVPLMRAAHAGMGEGRAQFREALVDYIAEETGHEAWILQDIVNSGGDAEAVQRGEPNEATRTMVNFAYRYVGEVNPMGFFGMVYVLEGTSAAFASQGAEAVAASLGLGPQCFTYLTSHGALDRDHMDFFRVLMDQVSDDADQEAVIELARSMFVLFANVFLSIPLELANADVA